MRSHTFLFGTTPHVKCKNAELNGKDLKDMLSNGELQMEHSGNMQSKMKSTKEIHIVTKKVHEFYERK